jgi:hypothetical protein
LAAEPYLLERQALRRDISQMRLRHTTTNQALSLNILASKLCAKQ